MGWRRKLHSHECRRPQQQPPFRRVVSGDEWVCPKCGRIWELAIFYPPTGSYVFQWYFIGHEGPSSAG